LNGLEHKVVSLSLSFYKNINEINNSHSKINKHLATKNNKKKIELKIRRRVGIKAVPKQQQQ